MSGVEIGVPIAIVTCVASGCGYYWKRKRKTLDDKKNKTTFKGSCSCWFTEREKDTEIQEMTSGMKTPPPKQEMEDKSTRRSSFIDIDNDEKVVSKDLIEYYFKNKDEPSNSLKLKALHEMQNDLQDDVILLDYIESVVIPRISDGIKSKHTFTMNKDGNFSNVDDNLHLLLGLSKKEEIQGQNSFGWTRNLHIKDYRKVVIKWMYFQNSGKLFYGKFRFDIPDKDIVYIFCYITNKKDGYFGKVISMEGTIYEISEEKYYSILGLKKE